jgi:hypothetical protein
LALISPTSGGRSVGIFRSRAKVTEFSFFSLIKIQFNSVLRLRAEFISQWPVKEQWKKEKTQGQIRRK